MARVRSIPSDQLAPDVADIYQRFAADYGPFRNQVADCRTDLAHHLCGFFNRCNDALQIKQEDAPGQQPQSLAQRR